MEFLRTPDHRFEKLSGYNFAPNYIETVDNLRLHYLDEGPKDARHTMLLLHGEPSWSYLYRKMIPIFVAAGYRVIAPDLIGFGKSDKPKLKSDYTYQKHLDWIRPIVEDIIPDGTTIFIQDWGGLIGMRMVHEYDAKFNCVIAGNTFLPTGYPPANEAFLQWQKFSQESPKFSISKVLQMATVSDLSEDVLAAYDAPFPDDTYKAGARIFPALVPTDTDDPEAKKNVETWSFFKQWTKPFLTLFSDSDPIMSGAEKYFQKVVPGATDLPHQIIKGGGHFLQEDKGEEIASIIVTFMTEQFV